MGISYMHGADPVPMRGDTIGGALDRAAADHGEGAAIVSRHQGIRLTYRELQSVADHAAGGLMALGVGPGDRVGIWSPNCAEWLITQHAVARAGAVLVTLDPASAAGELEFLLNHAGVSVLIMAVHGVSTDYLAVLSTLVPPPDPSTPAPASRLPGLRHVVCLPSNRADPGREIGADCLSWQALIDRGRTMAVAEIQARTAAVQIDDPAAIMYTSGTTGVPKGAVMSHHSLLNTGFFVGERLRYGPNDRVCLPVPFVHVLGCVLGSLAALTHASAIVMPGPLFDPRTCLDTIEAEQCSALYGVPSMFSAILRHPAFLRARVESLRTGIMAGAPCPVALMRDVIERLHVPDITICYGTTETGTLCQSLPDDPLERRVSTVGAVHQHMECKIVDPSTDLVVPRDTPGEMWARGYGVTLGYWNGIRPVPELEAPGDWFRTGDLAVMRDDGYVCIVGRQKDVVISGGENIYPREIEDVLRTHPAIRDVAVIGVPDPLHGEVTCAWILLHEQATLTFDDVRLFCRGRMAPHKVPRRVRFTDQLPTTTSGKVQKFRLRERSVRELGLEAVESIRMT